MYGDGGSPHGDHGSPKRAAELGTVDNNRGSMAPKRPRLSPSEGGASGTPTRDAQDAPMSDCADDSLGPTRPIGASPAPPQLEDGAPARGEEMECREDHMETEGPRAEATDRADGGAHHPLDRPENCGTRTGTPLVEEDCEVDQAITEGDGVLVDGGDGDGDGDGDGGDDDQAITEGDGVLVDGGDGDGDGDGDGGDDAPAPGAQPQPYSRDPLPRPPQLASLPSLSRANAPHSS